MEPALGGGREAAFLDHGHEVTQVPQLHSRSMPEEVCHELTKSFSMTAMQSLESPPWKQGRSTDKPLLSNVLYASAGYQE